MAKETVSNNEINTFADLYNNFIKDESEEDVVSKDTRSKKVKTENNKLEVETTTASKPLHANIKLDNTESIKFKANGGEYKDYKLKSRE